MFASDITLPEAAYSVHLPLPFPGQPSTTVHTSAISCKTGEPGLPPLGEPPLPVSSIHYLSTERNKGEKLRRTCYKDKDTLSTVPAKLRL